PLQWHAGGRGRAAGFAFIKSSGLFDDFFRPACLGWKSCGGKLSSSAEKAMLVVDALYLLAAGVVLAFCWWFAQRCDRL
ncbi:MAG: hypothetical protein ACTHJX_11940, partial [Terriglobales bacterium]